MKLRIVPARTGVQWVREGVRIFLRMPLAYAGLMVMFMTAAVALTLIPLAGPVLALALTPAATVGMMAATRQAVQPAGQGRFPTPAILLTALRQSPRQTRAMLALCAIYAAALLLITIIAAPLDDGKLAQWIASHGQPITLEQMMSDPDLRQAKRAAARHLAALLLLYIPVTIPLWHAPALVHWHGLPVGKSLFFSTVAVLRNAPAYLMYGLGWVAVSSVLWAALLTIASLMGNPLALATGGIIPLTVLIASMFYASLWFTFRDSFDAGEQIQ